MLTTAENTYKFDVLNIVDIVHFITYCTDPLQLAGLMFAGTTHFDATSVTLVYAQTLSEADILSVASTISAYDPTVSNAPVFYFVNNVLPPTQVTDPFYRTILSWQCTSEMISMEGVVLHCKTTHTTDGSAGVFYARVFDVTNIRVIGNGTFSNATDDDQQSWVHLHDVPTHPSTLELQMRIGDNCSRVDISSILFAYKIQ